MYQKHHLDYRDFRIAMQSKSYSGNTIKNYLYYLKLFLEYTNKPRTKITQVDVKKYMNEIRMCDNSAKNQTINSIKAFFKYVLDKKLDTISIERPRKKNRLPRVIDSEVLENRLSQVDNLKHRAILELGYRCGLRVSEVCNVLIKDIDSDRMLILVRDSKFNKDRYVPMSKALLNVLRNYFKQVRPIEYLFNGQFGLKYSHGSCQKIFKKYIDNTKSFHSLRHSYGTTLVERDVNMRIIQKSLGHKSSRTTEIYTHVSNISLQKAAI